MLKINHILILILVLLLLYLFFTKDITMEFLDAESVGKNSGIKVSGDIDLGSLQTGFGAGSMDSTRFGGSSGSVVTDISDITNEHTTGFNGTGSFGAVSLSNNAGKTLIDNGNYSSEIVHIPLEQQQMLNRGTYNNTSVGTTYTTPQYVNVVDDSLPITTKINTIPSTIQTIGTLSDTPTTINSRNTIPMNNQKGLFDGTAYMRTHNGNGNICSSVHNLLKTAINNGQINQGTVSDIWNGGQTIANICGQYDSYQ